MIERPFLMERIHQAWAKRPIVWLSGARRVEKTILTKILEQHIYMNCDLPSVHRKLEDPEAFYESIASGSILVYDEIHRLEDPSRVLKTGAEDQG